LPVLKLFHGQESDESLSKAKEIVECWYLQLRGKLRAGEIKSEKTFREVSPRYLHEYDIMTRGNATSDIWMASTGDRAFTGSPSSGTSVSQRSPPERFRNTESTGTKKQPKTGQANWTQHDASGNRDAALDSQTALGHGWLDRLPDFSEPYRSSPEICHRAWFSPEEYKKVYEARRKRAPEPKKKEFNWEAEVKLEAPGKTPRDPESKVTWSLPHKRKLVTRKRMCKIGETCPIMSKTAARGRGGMAYAADLRKT